MDKGLAARFQALSKAAYLDLLVPRDAEFDALTALRKGDPAEIGRAASRRNLFFDERAQVQLILKTPADEAEAKGLLPSLELVLAAHATDAVPQGSGNTASASGKQDLESIIVPGSEALEPVTVGEHTYIIWKPSVHIPWPRVRLQRPAIYFTATLTLNNNAPEPKKEPQDPHLPPYEPLAANVLEPLNTDPDFQGKEIYLPDNRVTKVAPRPPRREDDIKPVRGASKRAFPTVPALFTRMNYCAMPDGVIASLTLETSQVVAGTFNVEKVAVQSGRPKTDEVKASAEEGITSVTAVDWPLRMRSGDETVLLYRLVSASATPSTLSVDIATTFELDQGSRVSIYMSWQSQVGASQSSLEPTYRWSRPLSQHSSSSTQTTNKPFSADGTSKAEDPSSKVGAPGKSDGGISLFFSAPPTIGQSKELQLKIKCINKSARTRRFVLVPLHSPRGPEPRASQDSAGDKGDGQSKGTSSSYRRTNPANAICETPDIRIGPLATGDIYETEIGFQVLNTGVLDLGTVRVVDLDSRQTVDVRELPDVIALEASEDDLSYERRGIVPHRNDEIGNQMDAVVNAWRKETAKWLAQRTRSTRAAQ